MDDDVVKSLTLDRVIGQNLSAQRKKRQLTVTAFAGQMRAYVGQGWSRQEVYKFESGERALSALELVAAAMVLECTVGELTTSDGPVEVGAQRVGPHQLIDALSRASAEVEGWQRFEEATDALNDLRAAAARYITATGYVRERVAVSPSLRRRIAAFGKRSRSALEQQLAEMDDYRRDPADGAADDPRRVSANVTPAIVAASDALDKGRDVERLAWLWNTALRGDRANG